MANPFDLTGRTAVVTGANTGIGQAIAAALAEAGASIVAVGRSSMEETEALVKQAGSRFHVVKADLGTRRLAPGRYRYTIRLIHPVNPAPAAVRAGPGFTLP